MTSEIIMGLFFVAVGLVFLLVPLEALRKVFPRMRSKVFTKVFSGLVLAGGILMVVWQLV